MKKVFSIALGFCFLIPVAGCGAVKTSTPPASLAPGALNQFDSDTYRSLATAHAFAQSAAGNAATLTPTEKAALNQFIQYLNLADTLYVAYHSGAATQAAMQTALNAVNSSEASYTATITGGK
jgi:hypothetical protein